MSKGCTLVTRSKCCIQGMGAVYVELLAHLRVAVEWSGGTDASPSRSCLRECEQCQQRQYTRQSAFSV